MARSTTAGSKPAASITAKKPVKGTKKKAAAVKKTTSGAPLKLARAAKAPARKRPAKVPAKVPSSVRRRWREKRKKASVLRGRRRSEPVAPAKPAFGAKFLAQQQKSLLEERDNYTRQAESLRAEADALVADFEPGDVQFDEESGEGDTLNTERERDLALSAQARQAVEEITHALSKFADGTYGICEISGDPIPVERLEAIPWARERVEYKIGGLGRR